MPPRPPPDTELREPPSLQPSVTITTVHRASASEVTFTTSAPRRETDARLLGTHTRTLSAPPPVVPSMVPSELSWLGGSAELLCEFPFRPGVKKYRLLRRSRIVDVYSIPQSDFSTCFGAGSGVHVLLLPSQASMATAAEALVLSDTPQSSDSAGKVHGAEVATSWRTLHTPSPSASPGGWRSFLSWPNWAEGGPSTEMYADYLRLGSTVQAPPEHGLGVLDGTAIVFAPISLGTPLQTWPTTVPVPGVERLIVSFQPTLPLTPTPDSQYVEHLIKLQRFDWPVRDTIVLFKPGALLGPSLDSEASRPHSSGHEHWWLAELLGTLFESVPSHNLGKVTIVGLETTAPSWPRNQAAARADLGRMLDHFVGQTSTATSARRDWGDVKAAHLLSFEAYRTTVTPASFELETCRV